jgi:phosphatidylglycerol:prolipoprotein diacylglycerol transferase
LAYQPAAAYELLFSAALFGLLFWLRFRLSPPGTLFVTWLVLYSIGQFVLFFGRANVIVLFGLKQAQITSIVVVAVAVPLWLWYRRRYPVAAGESGGESGALPLDAPSAP